jgi:hypothetical protein
MSNPDAFTAFMGGSDITLMLADVSQRLVAEEAGFRTILENVQIEDNTDVMTTFLVFDERYVQVNREMYDAFMCALDEAVQLLQDGDETATAIVADRVGMDSSILKKHIKDGYTKFSSDLATVDIEPYVNIALEMEFVQSVKPLAELVFD